MGLERDFFTDTVHAISGHTTLLANEGYFSSSDDGETRSKLVIPASDGITLGVLGGVQAARKYGNGRHLQTQRRDVLVIRINGRDASTSLSKNQLSDDIFGLAGDRYNLVSIYNGCSYGQLQFSPFSGRTETGVSISDGVFDLNMPDQNFRGRDTDTVMQSVETLASSVLGDLPGQFDHVMFW